MDRPVRDHTKDLEQRRDLLNARITEESDAEQRKQVETELRAVESTLKFYRDALESERRLFEGQQMRNFPMNGGFVRHVRAIRKAI
jgi:hypothetical protein